MRNLIENLNRAALVEARGTRYMDRVVQAWELFLRDVLDAMTREMQDAGYETTRTNVSGGSLWADFKPRDGFKPVETGFVQPEKVAFWVQIDREDRLEGHLTLAGMRPRMIKRVNLIDDRDMASPEGLAGHLIGGDGRMDILGTWG